MKALKHLLFLTLALASLGLPSHAEEPWLQTEWREHSEGVQSRPFTKLENKSSPLFSRIEGPSIGIDFHNQLNDENIRNYLTTGAGLTVGDVDKNGLPDLFLVSQDGPNKLFLQVSPWKFQDATKQYGIKDHGYWGSGAAFADINNDGDLDLYLCNKAAPDRIYLNQGNGTFKGEFLGKQETSDRAPTMVSFCDFDLDGDLDLYRTETRLWALNEKYDYKVKMIKSDDGQWHPAPEFEKEFEIKGGVVSELGTFDRLFRNEGLSSSGEVQYQDITRRSGIKIAREHGLAATWWDYNNDNYPDLYISNDFHTPDHLYRNNKNGTFTEMTGEAFPYTSWSSMGSDFADINNDGWFDYLSTDMSGTTHFKQKTMMGAMTATSWFLDNLEPRQYMRNALQVNTGTGSFLETAFFSGIDSTDWTWAGIFGDLDNDGFEDAFFSNGIERNFQDSDLSQRMTAAKDEGATREEIRQILLDSPRFKERNLVFKNRGDLQFENESEQWGLSDLTVSHGALFCDLDRDGDLDVIVNNMNDPVGIYRNNSSSNHALLVSLRGSKSNHFGLGTRVEVLLEDGSTLTRLMTSSRGYMSGVEPVLHFGLGENAIIKSFRLTWPSGIVQSCPSLSSNHHYRITEASTESTFTPSAPPSSLFSHDAPPPGLDFTHRENDYNDFADQPLLPNRLSRFGPALASGDINGDGLADIFIGGATSQSAALFIQLKEGGFKEVTSPALALDQICEDVDAIWFDADGDKDLDLYVVSGGASFPAGSPQYRDRLYLNDGTGALTKAPTSALPQGRSCGSSIAPCDIDGDGDLDLFVGARFVPQKYPTTPESALLINDKGTFTRQSSVINKIGLVTGATWADLDQDGRPDLVVSTEWGPVRIFKNTKEGLLETTEQANLSTLTGWWTSVATGDFDHDGDLDIIAGNFGLNTKYHVNSEHPATLFAADFGKTGELQLVEAKQIDGKLLPIRGRSCSTSAMPHLLKKAPSYTSFARLSLPELYTKDALDTAQHLEANTLATTLFKNDGKGVFTAKPLPALSQLAPVMSITTADFNDDGFLDVALGQNFNAAQRETGRMNAGLSVLLTGSKNGTLNELWPAQSGLTLRTDTRQIIATDLNGDEKPDLLIGANNEPLRVLIKR